MEAIFGFLAALVFIVVFCLVREHGDKDFDEWFQALLVCAGQYGYTEMEIDEFQESDWYVHYSEGLNPCHALETEKYGKS